MMNLPTAPEVSAMISKNNARLERAFAFAEKKHAGQKYGEFAYTVHLQAVEAVMRRFGLLMPVLYECAALHDTLEDTDATFEEIHALFGELVAHIVAAVTEPKGGNRKWRHEQTYPRIREAGAEAVAVKLADRIANVEAGGSKVQMYRKEHPEFRRELYITDIPGTQFGGLLGSIQAMQDHLDLLIAKL